MARTPLKTENTDTSDKKIRKPQKKGFAAMSPERVGEIAHKGGAARAAQLGHGGYVALGHLGGQARARQLGPQGFAALGRHGAEIRAQKAALKTEERISKGKIKTPAKKVNDNISSKETPARSAKNKR